MPVCALFVTFLVPPQTCGAIAKNEKTRARTCILAAIDAHELGGAIAKTKTKTKKHGRVRAF